MGRYFWCGLSATALLVGTVSFLAYPLSASAQQPQDPQMFRMRMSSRIDTIQMRIRSLENELTSEGSGERGSTEFEAGGGMLRQLEDLDKQCRDLERQIDSLGAGGMGFPGQLYEQQRQIEYYVWTLDRQVQQIRQWLHPTDDKTESSVEPQPEIDTEEDGISDEDWAAEWAKGDR